MPSRVKSTELALASNRLADRPKATDGEVDGGCRDARKGREIAPLARGDGDQSGPIGLRLSIEAGQRIEILIALSTNLVHAERVEDHRHQRMSA